MKWFILVVLGLYLAFAFMTFASAGHDYEKCLETKSKSTCLTIVE